MAAFDARFRTRPLGGKKIGPNPTDRGKGGIKRSLLTDGQGIPLAVVVDGANRHDMKLVKKTLKDLKLERPRLTAWVPQNRCLDKGYDYIEVLDLVTEFGFAAHIRSRGEEAQDIT